MRKDGATVRTDQDQQQDALEVIELATAVLVRNFEMHRRRSTVYTDVDRAEYLVLRVLDALGPLDVCSLANALGVDPSTAGRQVGGMEGKGLVSRTPSPDDRRRTILAPTAQGTLLMTQTRDRRRTETAELLGEWSTDELRTLGEMFTRYNDSVAARYLVPTPVSR